MEKRRHATPANGCPQRFLTPNLPLLSTGKARYTEKKANHEEAADHVENVSERNVVLEP